MERSFFSPTKRKIVTEKVMYRLKMKDEMIKVN